MTERQHAESAALVPVGPPMQSLLGTTLQAVMTHAAHRAAEERLALAQQAFDQNPDLEATIWLGRRTAYLHALERAIAIYSEGLQRYPNAFQLYRHRGHRLISLRRFDAAVADFEAAARLAHGQPVEIEPDGLPNALNQPLSNSHFNIFYHLGLAYYLRGDYALAERAYQRCMQFSDNNDSIVATSDWLWMTYRRLGQEHAAQQVLDQLDLAMPVVESDSYLNRLQMYAGQRSPGSLIISSGSNDDAELTMATQGYGVGNWYYVNGDIDRARAIFQRVLNTRAVTAFGYIASEVELARGL